VTLTAASPVNIGSSRFVRPVKMLSVGLKIRCPVRGGIPCMDARFRGLFRVGNLWPECPAHDVYWTVAHGTQCKNPGKPVVAATLEKAKTYVFAEPLVWDREVGSNPFAPIHSK
jgi:hypothetical protein